MSSARSSRTLIELSRVSREDSLPGGRSRCLLKDVSWSLREGQKLAVFSDVSKSANALLECVSGVIPPQSGGKVEIRANVSWPLPSRGGLEGVMTGRQNSKFLHAVYGTPGKEREQIARIEELSSFAPGRFDQSMKSWSPLMRARFDVALSLVFDFDVYVVCKRFPWSQPVRPELESLVREAFERRVSNKTLLLFHQDEEFLARYCDEAIVISDCRIVYQGAFAEAQQWFHLNAVKSGSDDDSMDQEIEDSSSEPAEESFEEVELW